MANNKLYLGEGRKAFLSIKTENGKTMDEYDFYVEVYCNPAEKVFISKSDMKRLDEKSYQFTFNTRDVGKGRLRYRIVAEIPDADFKDGLSPAIDDIDTGLDIVD